MASLRASTDLTARRRRAVLAVLCLSLLVIGLDNTILNVALPTLVRDLHANASQLQWIVDAYALVFAGLLLPAGALGDRLGRKGILLSGLGVFGAASLAAMLVDDPSTLIGLRAVIGVGAALVMPTTLSSEVIMKATSVDGIYTGDPKRDKRAKFIPELTFKEALIKGYAVMDANAFGLCKENQLPIVVFNINQPGAIGRVLAGERVGTIVR